MSTINGSRKQGARAYISCGVIVTRLATGERRVTISIVIGVIPIVMAAQVIIGRRISSTRNLLSLQTQNATRREQISRSQCNLFTKGISADISQHLGPAPTSAGAEYKAREDGSTMKALAWFGTTDVRVIDAPIPDITEPNDVILQVTGSTICGSDLHLYHGEIMALQKGDILGHEVSPTFNDRLIPHSRTTTL